MHFKVLSKVKTSFKEQFLLIYMLKSIILWRLVLIGVTMATYSNRICNKCGLKRPQYNMVQKEITTKVGKSGGSASTSINSNRKSTRVSSGRNYYRTKLVWICAENSCHDPSYFKVKRERELDQEDKEKKLPILLADLKEFFKIQEVKNEAFKTAIGDNENADADADARLRAYSEYKAKSKHHIPEYHIFCRMIADRLKDIEVSEVIPSVVKPIILNRKNKSIYFTGHMFSYLFYKLGHFVWLFLGAGINYLISLIGSFQLRRFIRNMSSFEKAFLTEYIACLNGMAKNQLGTFDKKYHKENLDEYFVKRKLEDLEVPKFEKLSSLSKEEKIDISGQTTVLEDPLEVEQLDFWSWGRAGEGLVLYCLYFSLLAFQVITFGQVP